MRLLPLERLTLRSNSPPEVVVGKLATLVAAPSFSWRRPPEPFRGSIQGNHFKLVRVLGTFLGLPTRNSWQPVIIGDIAAASGGTEVRVRMRLQVLVAAFMVVWFGGLFSMAAVLVWGGLRDGFGPGGCENGTVGFAFIGGMALFGYLLMSVAFWTEVKKARTLLCEGLGCREGRAQNRLVR